MGGFYRRFCCRADFDFYLRALEVDSVVTKVNRSIGRFRIGGFSQTCRYDVDTFLLARENGCGLITSIVNIVASFVKRKLMNWFFRLTTK